MITILTFLILGAGSAHSATPAPTRFEITEHPNYFGDYIPSPKPIPWEFSVGFWDDNGRCVHPAGELEIAFGYDKDRITKRMLTVNPDEGGTDDCRHKLKFTYPRKSEGSANYPYIFRARFRGNGMDMTATRPMIQGVVDGSTRTITKWTASDEVIPELFITLDIPKTVVRAGDPISVILKYRNISKRPTYVWNTNWEQAARETLAFLVEDENGRQLPIHYPNDMFAVRAPGWQAADHEVGRVTLKPGEELVREIALAGFRLTPWWKGRIPDMQKKGSYVVRAVYCPSLLSTWSDGQKAIVFSNYAKIAVQ